LETEKALKTCFVPAFAVHRENNQFMQIFVSFSHQIATCLNTKLVIGFMIIASEVSLTISWVILRELQRSVWLNNFWCSWKFVMRCFDC
jgi:hypothetical protein